MELKKTSSVEIEDGLLQENKIYQINGSGKLSEMKDAEKSIGLRKVLKRHGKSQIDFSKENGLTQVGVLKICKAGAIVVDGRVYRPTKYTVEK